ncbi:MAG: lysophospholipid acyltransferase family protein [Nautiliaceae bacterium]
MKILNSIISSVKFLYGFGFLAIVSILIAINPKWELKLRKKASKILTSLIAKEIIIEGEIDPTANILMGNHTNNLDIPLMETVYGNEKIIWVAKDEIAKMPIFKYLVTKSDMILANRNDKRAIIKMIKDIKEKTQKGYKVFLFPEGTRNKGDYTKLLTFKNGPKGIVEKLNLKVQPFVIINLPKAFKKNPFRIEKQKIKIVFLKSFYPYEGWYEDMRNNMQQILDKEYKK